MRAAGTLIGLLGLLLVFHRRPDRVLLLALLMAMALPYFATPTLMGYGPLSTIHPATILVLGGTLLTAFLPGDDSQPVRIRPPLFLGFLLLVVTVMAGLLPVLFGRTGSVSILANQIIAPILFIIAARKVARTLTTFSKQIVVVVLVAAALQASLAVAQSILSRIIFFEGFYAGQTFAGGEGTDR